MAQYCYPGVLFGYVTIGAGTFTAPAALPVSAGGTSIHDGLRLSDLARIGELVATDDPAYDAVAHAAQAALATAKNNATAAAATLANARAVAAEAESNLASIPDGPGLAAAVATALAAVTTATTALSSANAAVATASAANAAANAARAANLLYPLAGKGYYPMVDITVVPAGQRKKATYTDVLNASTPRQIVGNKGVETVTRTIDRTYDLEAVQTDAEVKAALVAKVKALGGAKIATIVAEGFTTLTAANEWVAIRDAARAVRDAAKAGIVAINAADTAAAADTAYAAIAWPA